MDSYFALLKKITLKFQIHHNNSQKKSCYGYVFCKNNSIIKIKAHTIILSNHKYINGKSLKPTGLTFIGVTPS